MWWRNSGWMWRGCSAKGALSFCYQPHRERNDYIKEFYTELCTNMSESWHVIQDFFFFFFPSTWRDASASLDAVQNGTHVEGKKGGWHLIRLWAPLMCRSPPNSWNLLDEADFLRRRWTVNVSWSASSAFVPIILMCVTIGWMVEKSTWNSSSFKDLVTVCLEDDAWSPA